MSFNAYLEYACEQMFPNLKHLCFTKGNKLDIVFYRK